MNTDTGRNWAGGAPAHVEEQLSVQSAFPVTDGQPACVAAARAGHEGDEPGSLTVQDGSRHAGVPAWDRVPRCLPQLDSSHNRQIVG